MTPTITVDARGAIAKFSPAGIPEHVRNSLRQVIPDLTKRLGARVESKLDSELKSRARLQVTKEMIENPTKVVGRVQTVATSEPKLLPQWLETGTRAHPIFAKNAGALSFFWGKMGRHVMFKAVSHPGFAGINYMQRSFQEMETEIFDTMTRAVTQGVREAAYMASTLYEPIMEALLALLQTKCGAAFNTYSRRFVTWEDLQQQIQNGQVIKQPALLLYSGPGFGGGTTRYAQKGRTPAMRTITRTIVIYAQIPGGGTPGGPDTTTPGDDPFYDLIETVEAALNPPDSDSLATITLGGLVTHCWIEGDGVIVPGDIDPNGQGMATLPVTMLIP